MSFEMDRKTYSQMFGPTTGDSVRLGDTDLFAKVEKTTQFTAKKVNSLAVKFYVMVWDKAQQHYVSQILKLLTL